MAEGRCAAGRSCQVKYGQAAMFRPARVNGPRLVGSPPPVPAARGRRVAATGPRGPRLVGSPPPVPAAAACRTAAYPPRDCVAERTARLCHLPVPRLVGRRDGSGAAPDRMIHAHRASPLTWSRPKTDSGPAYQSPQWNLSKTVAGRSRDTRTRATRPRHPLRGPGRTSRGCRRCRARSVSRGVRTRSSREADRAPRRAAACCRPGPTRGRRRLRPARVASGSGPAAPPRR